MSALTRRDVLLGSVAASFAVTAGTRAGVARDAFTHAPKPPPYVPYTDDSFFKSRVASAPVDNHRTAVFHAFMATHPDQRAVPYPHINGVDGNEWGTAFASGRDRHPIWRITGEFRHEVSHLATRGFHAPEWLADMFTGTNDSPFCVMDRAFGITVFGTNAKVVAPYTVSVSSAGCTYHGSNGLDHRNPRSNDQRNFTSRGRISDAMVIRRSLVRHGIRHNTDLGHVLHLFLCLTDAREASAIRWSGQKARM